MSNVFSDAQIQEIMEIFTKTYGAEHRQYIGARYVPIFGRKNEDSIEWDDSAPYEPLTIVLHEGNSYTSRQYVPKGIDILNGAYWANTGNYSAQIEQYRLEVAQYRTIVDGTVIPAVNKNTEDIANEIIRATDKENEIDSKFSKKTGYVTPEQFGAIGNGTNDDTKALQDAIDSGKYVIGVGDYHCTDTITVNNSHQRIVLKSIISDASDYALSIMHGTFGQEIVINQITAAHNGVLATTDKITARHNMHFGVISANDGIAFNFIGGNGGVLDCYLSGQVWEGTASGLTIAPSKSFIGNITFDSIRFAATNESATQLTLDSANGSITQLHFPNCSAEPEGSTSANNGILINVVNSIEFCDGYFRTTELTNKTGYILKIAGNLTNQLRQGLHFTFDHILPSKIDLSELTMSRYYALDAPICIIDCNQIIFASQPQSLRMTIKGNKKHCKPIRGRYALSSADYTWDYSKQIANAIEFTGNGTLNIPEWFDPDEDSLMVNCAGHSVVLKIDEYGTTETIATLSDSGWIKLSFYRDNNNKLYIVKS